MVHECYKDPVYIKKQRESHLGSRNGNWKGGISPSKLGIKKGYNPNSAVSFLGHHHTEETKQIMREKKLGSNAPKWKGGPIPRICQTCGIVFPARRYAVHNGGGKFCSPKCQGIGRRGKFHPMWKGGMTSLYKRVHNLPEYKEWRHKVFVRDRFTCVECRKVGGKLNAHHIKSFKQIFRENKIESILEAQMCKELWIVENGITLCEECHKLTKSFKKSGKERGDNHVVHTSER